MAFVTLAGQVIVGFWLSCTVTVNVQLLELPAASLTEQVTVVTPAWKVEPEAGEQVGVPTPGQLSPTVGAANVATALHWPLLLGTVTLAGQLIVGFCVSLTVTVKVQLPRLFAASITEQVTVVTPFWNIEPDAGKQVGMPTPAQLSLAVGAL